MRSTKWWSFVLCFEAALVSGAQTQPTKASYGSEQTAVVRQQALASFNFWVNRYATNSSLKTIGEGVALAKERRKAFVELIKSDPGRALAASIPDSMRKHLPPEIAD